MRTEDFMAGSGNKNPPAFRDAGDEFFLGFGHDAVILVRRGKQDGTRDPFGGAFRQDTTRHAHGFQDPVVGRTRILEFGRRGLDPVRAELAQVQPKTEAAKQKVDELKALRKELRQEKKELESRLDATAQEGKENE